MVCCNVPTLISGWKCKYHIRMSVLASVVIRADISMLKHRQNQ